MWWEKTSRASETKKSFKTSSTCVGIQYAGLLREASPPLRSRNLKKEWHLSVNMLWAGVFRRRRALSLSVRLSARIEDGTQ